MDSRLLATLNAQASNTRDPVIWARAVCRAASHFARHGMTKEALKSISVVRAQFGKELHPEVVSWLMLAEGVLHFFQVQTHESYDRIRRAYGLAVALQTESALPSCAAWMAHFEFNECMYDRMASHLSEALTLAMPDDHQARARASLVMADAFHLAGRYDLARPWYEETRQRAAAEGDEATLSAMLYNVAAFRAANVRLADTFGLEITTEAHRAKMEAASSFTYDFAIETQGLGFLTQMLRGLISTVQKEYKSAFDIFISIDTNNIPKRLLGPVFADLAWCSVNLSNFDKGWQYAKIAANSLSDISEADDLAYIASRISETAAVCNRMGESVAFRETAMSHLETHRDFQEKLLSQLNSIRVS
jgi:hypothetical protein